MLKKYPLDAFTYQELLANDNKGGRITTPDPVKISELLQHRSVKHLIYLKKTNSTSQVNNFYLIAHFGN